MRIALAAALAATAVTTVLAAGGPVVPAEAEARPTSWAIPGDKTHPEGIALDRGQGAFYTGSFTDGTIYRGDVKTGKVEAFLPAGADGRTSALGMKVDDAGRLIIAGGTSGKVWVYDLATRKLLKTFSTGVAGSFLNDLVVTMTGDVYVTDSQLPTLYEISAKELGEAGQALVPLRPFLDLRGTPINYQAEGPNLNGIALSEDQSTLVVADSNDGELFTINRRTREVRKLDLGGLKVSADGLLIGDRELITISTAPGNRGTVHVFQLDHLAAKGKLRHRLDDPALLSPSTGAFAGSQEMLVVNLQWGVEKPVLPFSVVRIRLPLPRDARAH
ncbi:SMP-30/gluconolactonase/LRE family protein [Allokutzneria sp. A3M-2-11 16]|uniref:SMP-30/gluconolactonase/LRE family protein n=1 Tax=Allokutzneria sp. A3M-2-11 16 TaxID=2962043 RepID=UPI0020B7F59D|nr:SMP-30/gluconolactonase/LRE family protein [Allokutzneria sp. A3M-2-11 16]MCP3802405.1 SMP-30/gluconolactonase/LRE family protein [Allokutzneria sp. A3M-2-11 16]